MAANTQNSSRSPLDLRQPAKQCRSIEAQRLGELQELDNVDPPLPPFDVGDICLGPPDFFC